LKTDDENHCETQRKKTLGKKDRKKGIPPVGARKHVEHRSRVKKRKREGAEPREARDRAEKEP